MMAPKNKKLITTSNFLAASVSLTNGVNAFFPREVAKTLFCHVPVWWETCTRRTPTQSWHPRDGYGLMFDRTSRKTIPLALDSNEAQDVSFCGPPNGPPTLRPTPDRGAQIKIEQQRALKKTALWGGAWLQG